jgi:hypothetical protein
MGLRSVVVLVVVLAAIAAWGRWDEKLDPAAVTAMCQASEDAAMVERHAVRAFKDAAAANEEGGWDQGLIAIDESLSRRLERERRSQSLTALIVASGKRTDATALALRALGDLSQMHAEAARLQDDASILALARCRDHIAPPSPGTSH